MFFSRSKEIKQYNSGKNKLNCRIDGQNFGFPETKKKKKTGRTTLIGKSTTKVTSRLRGENIAGGSPQANVSAFPCFTFHNPSTFSSSSGVDFGGLQGQRLETHLDCQRNRSLPR